MTLNTILDNGTHKVQSSGIILTKEMDAAGISRLFVTSHATNRVVVEQGGSLDLTVEIRQGENVAPVTDSFAMPIRRIGGAVERTVMMPFVDGVCSKSIAFNDSGEFEVAQELVNMHLPTDSQFVFDGFYISVTEPE